MAFVDYYKIMGVPKDIPQSEIRRAYVKRAKQFHPDLHPDDPKAKAKFQALNEAYDVLNDPEKRKKYDAYGQHWKEAGQGFGGGGFNGANAGGGFSSGGFDFSQFTGGGGFSSFFEDLFGGGHRRSGGNGFGAGTYEGGFDGFRPQENYDKEARLNVDMYTAILGGEVYVDLAGGDRIKLKVKPYTQEGTKVRLRGKGNPKGDGTNGDLILTYHVQLPTKLTERQKDLLRQMQN